MVYILIDFKKETTNPEEMAIKYELVLNGMTQVSADKIENNNIGEFQTSDSNTPGYYIFNGQVMHIPHRNNIPVMISILQF